MSRKATLANRADLLRGWQACPELAFDNVAHLLGYFPEDIHKNSDTVVNKTDSQTSNEEKDTNTTTVNNDEKSISSLETTFYRLEARTKNPLVDNNPEAEDTDIPYCLRGFKPFQPGELAIPDNTEAALEQIPIVSEARLLPFLRRSLSQLGAKRLDVAKLIKKVSQLQPLYSIPQQNRCVPAGRICILLDRNVRVLPFWEDYHALCALVAKRQGKIGLEIKILNDNPGGEYLDWFDYHTVKSQQEPKPPQVWTMPEPNTVMLVLSDLGLLAKPWSVIRQQWLQFAKELRRNGLQPIALIPKFAPAQDETWQTNERELLKQFNPVVLDKTSRLNEQPIYWQEDNRDKKLQRLLGLVSPALHVEPQLLRAITYLLPADEADNGIEAAVWLHPHVVWGYTAFSLQPSWRWHYQQLFSQEAPILQSQVLVLIKQHHANQFPGVWAEELLQATKLIKISAFNNELPTVKALFHRFARTYYQQQDNLSMRHYAERHLARLDDDLKTEYAYTSVLFALSQKDRLLQGAAIPPEYNTQIVQAVVSTKIPSSYFQVNQIGANIECRETVQSTFDLPTYAAPIAVFQSYRDTVTLIEGNKKLILLPSESVLSKANSPAFKLQTDLETLTFAAFTKPTWAIAIGNNTQGLFIETQAATGERYRYYWHPPIADEQHGSCPGFWFPDTEIHLPWASQFGQDNFGLFAELTIKNTTQRFRWINPGTFEMGSPNNEPERYGNEIQHQVTLTQGYWLADTTCTQALWQAVMGNNPANFKEDNNNPVEQVSWYDVQTFIKRVNKLIPELQASLPTEAQWEYACRAGTSTRYSFGDEILPKQANYQNNHGKTMPVKSFPANAWGLHEMHGNVWEWCQDWYGDYPDHAVVDPTGPTDGSIRVSRGGSWISYAGNARSATRSHDVPDYRSSIIGFRLALGQTAKLGERRAVIGRTTAAERGGQAKHSTPDGSPLD